MRRFVFAGLLFSVAVSLLTPTAVFACTPDGPDAWYSHVVTVDETTLPDEIFVAADAQTGSSILRSGDEDPVYVVTPLRPKQKGERPEDIVPEGYYAWLKLADGVAYAWESWLKKNGDWDEIPDAVLLQGHVTHEGDLEQYHLPFRPSIVRVPDPVPFTLTLWKDGTLQQASGTLSYVLNPEYDPESGAYVGDPCAGFEEGEIRPPSKFAQFVGRVTMRVTSVIVGFKTWF